MAAKYEELKRQSSMLRLELKSWEKEFAAVNDGRKAGRDEIKQNEAIAKKYREYSRLRDILSMKVPPPPLPESPPMPSTKRRSQAIQEGTPLKRRRKDVHTPRKAPRPQIYMDKPLPDTPSSSSGTPAQRAFIGPTPQKDGQVLGLFDLLDSPASSTGTPSRPSTAAAPGIRMVLDATSSNRTKVPLTPSKARRVLGTHQASTPDENAARTPSSGSKSNDRTPQSSGTRFLLDKFATPSKRKRGLDTSHSNQATTSLPETLGAPKLQQPDSFSTPAFLRRDSDRFVGLSAVAEEEEEEEDGSLEPVLRSDGALSPSSRPISRRSSMHPPRPRFGRTFGRSLSSLMADVRKAEDERYDDDLDAMREIEDDRQADTITKPKAAVPDSHVPAIHDDALHLGPDGTHILTSDEADTADAEGSNRRVYKKRGAKRQARRVILRPAKKLPKSEEVVAAVQETQLLDSSSDADVGAEAEEATPTAQDADTTVFPYPSGSESEAQPSSEDDDDRDDEGASPRKRRKLTLATSSTTSAAATKNSTMPQDKDIKSSNLEIVRKAAKKVNAAAHANFRRLKIRSSKGAAGAGAKGKFGRRR